MAMKMYEAMLSHPDSIAQVRAAKRAVERVGGNIKLAPPNASGMVLVTLILPDRSSPRDFLPNLPFYTV